MTGAYRVMVIGHSPSRSSDPAVPLTSGPSGLNLSDLADLSVRWWSFLFHCVNLFPNDPRATTRSAVGERRTAARRLSAMMLGRRSILLGQDVARAFGVAGARIMEWTATPREVAGARLEVAVLPHPSPVSRWWLSPHNRRAAAEFLREEAAHAAGQAMDEVGHLPELESIARGR